MRLYVFTNNGITIPFWATSFEQAYEKLVATVKHPADFHLHEKKQ